MRAPRQTQCAQPSTLTARELHERVLVRVDATPAPHVPPGGGMKPAPVVRVRSPLVAASLARAARGRGVPASAFGWFGKRSAGAGASSTATLAMPPPRTARASWPSPTAPTTTGSSSSPPTLTRRSTRPTARVARFDPGTTSACLPPPCPTPASPSTPPPWRPNLGIPESDVQSERFARFFSGDADVLPGMETWATPYALSIMGQRQVSNCPFGNGNGYGDGRAVSVGRSWAPARGTGATPPRLSVGRCSSRAVGPPRSAAAPTGARCFDPPSASFSPPRRCTRRRVHHPRALPRRLRGRRGSTPLVPRRGGRCGRRAPNFTRRSAPRAIRRRDQASHRSPSVAARVRDPDAMIRETCAITTRVAPSFLRVGHVDLFSRRAVRAGKGTSQFVELEQIVRHAIFREFRTS